MNTYWTLYLLLKLDDIRNLFLNNYGLTFFVITMALIFTFIVTLVINGIMFDEDEEKVKDLIITRGKTSTLILIVVFLFQLTGNIIGTFLPTTGQAIAIYIGANTVNSETVKALSDIDPKLAKILKNKFDLWAQESLKALNESKDN